MGAGPLRLNHALITHTAGPPPHTDTKPPPHSLLPPTLIPTPPYRPSPALFHRHLLPSSLSPVSAPTHYPALCPHLPSLPGRAPLNTHQYPSPCRPHPRRSALRPARHRTSPPPCVLDPSALSCPHPRTLLIPHTDATPPPHSLRIPATLIPTPQMPPARIVWGECKGWGRGQCELGDGVAKQGGRALMPLLGSSHLCECKPTLA